MFPRRRRRRGRRRGRGCAGGGAPRSRDGRAGGGAAARWRPAEQEDAEPAEGEHYDDEQQTLLPAGQFHGAAPLLVPASRPQPERHRRRPFRRRRCRSIRPNVPCRLRRTTRSRPRAGRGTRHRLKRSAGPAAGPCPGRECLRCRCHCRCLMAGVPGVAADCRRPCRPWPLSRGPSPPTCRPDGPAARGQRQRRGRPAGASAGPATACSCRWRGRLRRPRQPPRGRVRVVTVRGRRAVGPQSRRGVAVRRRPPPAPDVPDAWTAPGPGPGRVVATATAVAPAAAAPAAPPVRRPLPDCAAPSGRPGRPDCRHHGTRRVRGHPAEAEGWPRASCTSARSVAPSMP